MFPHNMVELPYDYTSDFPLQDSAAPISVEIFPPPPLFIPPLHLHSLSALSSDFGCTPSPTSIATCTPPTTIHRSTSTASINSSPPSYHAHHTSVRKVLSTGDLQRSNRALVNECSIMESINRANPYSPEEKKERIERYRSKRYLRNFNKKIKYECRKTLADSRPRIRGRFVRSDEMEKAPQTEWEHATVDQYEDDYNWINFLDAFAANLIP